MSTTPKRTPGPPPVGHIGYYTQPKAAIPPVQQQRAATVPKPPPGPPPPSHKKPSSSIRKNLNFDLKGEEKKEEESISLKEMKLLLKLVSKSKGAAKT